MAVREPWEITRAEAIAKLSEYYAAKLAGLSLKPDDRLAYLVNEVHEEDGSYPMHYSIVEEEAEEEEEEDESPGMSRIL